MQIQSLQCPEAGTASFPSPGPCRGYGCASGLGCLPFLFGGGRGPELPLASGGWFCSAFAWSVTWRVQSKPLRGTQAWPTLPSPPAHVRLCSGTVADGASRALGFPGLCTGSSLPSVLSGPHFCRSLLKLPLLGAPQPNSYSVAGFSLLARVTRAAPRGLCDKSVCAPRTCAP